MKQQNQRIADRAAEMKQLKKLGFVIVNSSIQLIALTFMAIGIIIVSSFYARSSFLSRFVRIPGAMILVHGLIVYCVSLLAFAAVFWQKLQLLIAHIDSLIVLIGVEMALAISGFTIKTVALNSLWDTLRSKESKFAIDDVASMTWNSLQLGLECCGVDNSTEWFQYLGNSTVPDSCCVDYSIDCGENAFDNGNIYERGCDNAINQWFMEHHTAVAILLPIFILLKVLSIWLACAYRKVVHQYNSGFCPI